MSSKVEEFCSITGCDHDTARAFLRVCEDDMQIAVNMYMTDPSSVSIEPDSDYRPPIPQRTEILVPVELPPYIPSRQPRIASAFSGACSSPFSDEEEETELNGTIELTPTGSNSSSSPVLTRNGKNKKQCTISEINKNKNLRTQNKYTSSSSSSLASLSTTSVSIPADGLLPSTIGATKRKQGVLRQLFAPPSDLIFNGCLREALDAAKNNQKWLLLSLHDDSCFDCHILNRDVWKDYKVKNLIKRNFIFIQVDINSPDGMMYRSRYSYANSATQLAIMNPVSGDQEMMWTHLKDRTIICAVLTNFLLHSSFPTGAQVVPSSNSLDCVPITSTATTSVSSLQKLNRTVETDVKDVSSSSSCPSKRLRFTTDLDTESSPVYSIMDWTEEEQLELALKASVGASTILSPSVESQSESQFSSLGNNASVSHQIDLTSDESPIDLNENDDSESTLTTIDSSCSSSTSNSITLSESQVSLALSTLPKPADSKLAFRLALRLPAGNRIVLELDPSLQLEVLMRHLKLFGLSSSRYELVRIHPRLCLSDLPPTTRLIDSGLHQTDSIFLQEK